MALDLTHSRLPETRADCHVPPRAERVVVVCSRRGQRCSYGADEHGALYRLFEERDGTRLKRSLAHVVVPVRAHDDDRDPRARGREMSKKDRARPFRASADPARCNQSALESRIRGILLLIRTFRRGNRLTSRDCEAIGATMRHRRPPTRPHRCVHPFESPPRIRLAPW